MSVALSNVPAGTSMRPLAARLRRSMASSPSRTAGRGSVAARRARRRTGRFSGRTPRRQASRKPCAIRSVHGLVEAAAPIGGEQATRAGEGVRVGERVAPAQSVAVQPEGAGVGVGHDRLEVRDLQRRRGEQVHEPVLQDAERLVAWCAAGGAARRSA